LFNEHTNADVSVKYSSVPQEIEFGVLTVYFGLPSINTVAPIFLNSKTVYPPLSLNVD